MAQAKRHIVGLQPGCRGNVQAQLHAEQKPLSTQDRYSLSSSVSRVAACSVSECYLSLVGGKSGRCGNRSGISLDCITVVQEGESSRMSKVGSGFRVRREPHATLPPYTTNRNGSGPSVNSGSPRRVLLPLIPRHNMPAP